MERAEARGAGDDSREQMAPAVWAPKEEGPAGGGEADEENAGSTEGGSTRTQRRRQQRSGRRSKGGTPLSSPVNKPVDDTAKEVWTPNVDAKVFWLPNAGAQEFVPGTGSIDGDLGVVDPNAAGNLDSYDAYLGLISVDAEDVYAAWNTEAAIIPPVDVEAVFALPKASYDAERTATVDSGGKPKNYKVSLCRHYERGHCTLGRKCNFAHGSSELRAFNCSGGVKNGTSKDALKSESPRSALLTLCGAWGALVTYKPMKRNDILKFRYCPPVDTVLSEELHLIVRAAAL